MNKLLEMEIFVAVVDAGSISRASERLELAKSAISKRLTDLERRLGTQLLHRTTRKLSLSEAGTDFYARCKSILDEVGDAEAAITETGQALSGTIRLTAPLTFGVQHLGPALVQFMKAYPAVAAQVDFNDRRVDLIGEGFDLGIRISKLDDSSLMARRIAPARMVVAASPENPRAGARRTSPVTRDGSSAAVHAATSPPRDDPTSTLSPTSSRIRRVSSISSIRVVSRRLPLDSPWPRIAPSVKH